MPLSQNQILLRCIEIVLKEPNNNPRVEKNYKEKGSEKYCEKWVFFNQFADTCSKESKYKIPIRIPLDWQGKKIVKTHQITVHSHTVTSAGR